MRILQALSRSSLLGMVLLFLLFLLLAGHGHPHPASLSTSLSSKQQRQRRGLLVIPGLGRSDRLKTVEHNINLLEPYLSGDSPMLDCVIYIYTPRDSPSDFWQQENSLKKIAKHCDFIEHHGRRVTENLYMVQPSLIEGIYDFVFILFDDCKLIGFSESDQVFPLDKMLQIIDRNKLTIASPRVVGANTGGGQKFRLIMQTPAIEGTEGYVSSFVEMFCWVIRTDAYRALWQLLYPAVNPFGWGYDFWFDYYGKLKVPGHKMGITSNILVKHDQDFSAPGEGRTDTASVKEKWKGVQNQEKFYKTYLGIDLTHIRQNLDLSNTSWNGAVKGYLY